MNLQQTLESLRAGPKQYSFNVTSVTGAEGVFVGIDAENQPCIFIKSIHAEGTSLPAIKTPKLLVEFNKQYKLFVNRKNQETDTFHSIRCLTDSSQDVRIFCAVIDSILSDENAKFTAQSLTSVFYSLADLFKISPERDIDLQREGLWAELFFMKNYLGFERWLQFWHSDPMRLFDFSYENKRIEVKSTLRQERIHEFSHRQLFSLASEDIAIISFLLREDDSGLSLRQLIDEATSTFVGTHHFVKLQRAIIRAAMSDTTTEGPRYNETEAKSHISWFMAEDVPRFQTREPEGVSGTCYKSDLTNAPKIPEDKISKWLEEFGNTRPDS